MKRGIAYLNCIGIKKDRIEPKAKNQFLRKGCKWSLCLRDIVKSIKWSLCSWDIFKSL